MTTFEQFIASRRHVADLEKELGINIYDDPSIPCPGYVYLDSFYIEESCDNWTDLAKEGGRYFLIIGRVDWLSDDLDLLERTLWDKFVKNEVAS